jgi:hypothetical protein
MNTVQDIFPTLTDQRAAELHALNCTQHSAPEYADLADRLFDAAAKLKMAANTKSFSCLRSAYLDLSEIAYQTARMNDGLYHAIKTASRRAMS